MSSKQVDHSDLSTVSSSGSRLKLTMQKQKNRKQPKKQKKQSGLLDFINEKLSQWPLWRKIVSDQTSPFDSKAKAQISQQQLNIQRSKAKAIPLRQLPWLQFYSRGMVDAAYQYYHCPEDQKTYFSTKKFERNPVHEEIKQFPTNRRMLYVLDTLVARELLTTNYRRNYEGL